MFQRTIVGKKFSGSRRSLKPSTVLAHESLEGRMLLTANIVGGDVGTPSPVVGIDACVAAATPTGNDAAVAVPFDAAHKPVIGEAAPAAGPTLVCSIAFGTFTKKNPKINLGG